MQSLLVQVRSVQKKWAGISSSVGTDFSAHGIQGVSWSSVNEVLGDAVKLIQKASVRPSASVQVAAASISGLCQVIEGHINNIPSNPAHFLNQAIASVWQLWQSLLLAVSRDRANLKVSSAAYLADLVSAIGLVEKIQEKEPEIDRLERSLAASTESLSRRQAALDASIESVSSAKDTYDELTAELGRVMERLAADLDKWKKQSEQLESELKAAKSRADQLAAILAEFKGHRELVNNLIGDVNRSGLAHAFVERAKKLRVPMVVWVSFFIVALAGIIVFATQMVASVNSEKWMDLLLKLPLTAGFVWLGWFSARNYGVVARIKEDYEFKAASALSFEGYKREATKVDRDLLAKLLSISLDRFQEHPGRFFEANSNHGSPIQDALNAGAEAVAKAAKAVKGKDVAGVPPE